MKKKVIAFSIAVLFVSAGTVALATSNVDEEKDFNFKEMLPYMQQMHPDVSDEQLEEMYNNCHANGKREMMNGNMGKMMENR
ncbi:hypothetical protein SAMN05421736_103332 [Evansella caseinilytica]|uniref:FAD/FMN-containing dehydrogenase n=1 Tax=Evansella caseinilytica TaxID=1503961 RepID=A0A1H3MTK0_9BACI|nr:hypothetical protein [Evansella caseinilytica]SDY79906.1 hypothetical protein SAMN05421736_103332 [Evansella caseinilytica]